MNVTVETRILVSGHKLVSVAREKAKEKVFFVHALKVRREGGGITPIILRLGTSWR